MDNREKRNQALLQECEKWKVAGRESAVEEGHRPPMSAPSGSGGSGGRVAQARMDSEQIPAQLEDMPCGVHSEL